MLKEASSLRWQCCCSSIQLRTGDVSAQIVADWVLDTAQESTPLFDIFGGNETARDRPLGLRVPLLDSW